MIPVQNNTIIHRQMWMTFRVYNIAEEGFALLYVLVVCGGNNSVDNR